MNEFEALQKELSETPDVVLFPDRYTEGQLAGQFNVISATLGKHGGADRWTLQLNGAIVTSWSILAKKDFDFNKLVGHSIQLIKGSKRFICKLIA